MPVPIEPRPLNDSERAVLEHILSADVAGASALRSQLDRTEVVATWGAESVSVDLRVRGPVQHAPQVSRVVPVGAGVYDHSGEYIGDLLVWADSGATPSEPEGGATLSGLEYAWVTDEMPTCLPSIDQIRLVTSSPSHR
ncbi:hypothetical protein ACFZB9_07005 [Kitasatospora sp. NPDC008050]|uniref:hypothetical protein n=1 Tax=Kitasatospora sp. NPDC008050 TaxID=3364021 RepID=UPI0036EA4828